MKKLSCLILAIILSSCNVGDQCSSKELPECIELSEDLKTVRVQKVKGELHYWLNTDFVHFDGIEYIVNNKCDTVCSFCGECIQANCANDYEWESWEIIWKR